MNDLTATHKLGHNIFNYVGIKEIRDKVTVNLTEASIQIRDGRSKPAFIPGQQSYIRPCSRKFYSNRFPDTLGASTNQCISIFQIKIHDILLNI